MSYLLVQGSWQAQQGARPMVTVAPMWFCIWDSSRGMWVTHPDRWVYEDAARPVWVVVAFPYAADLCRGVVP